MASTPSAIDQKSLGELLRSERLSFDFSLRDLSSDSGVSASQVLRVESGEYGASLEVATRLARSMGLPVGLLVEACSAPSWKPYFEQLDSAPAFVGFVAAKRVEPKTKAAFLRHLVARSAAFMEHLVLSSNPVRWANAAECPVGEMKDHLVGMAQLIEDGFDAMARLDWIRQLQRDCFTRLRDCGVCRESVLAEFLKGQPGAVMAWNPFGELGSILQRRPQAPVK